MNAGWDVKVSEVHGMSQRGGSVVTYVRAASPDEKMGVASPIIPNGEVDLLLAFEELEALRWAHCVRKEGAVAVNLQKMEPMPVITGAAVYPEKIIERIQEKVSSVITINAMDLALQAGNQRASNVVLLGALSTKMNFTVEEWKKALEETVKPAFLEVNLKAFELGRQAAENR